MCWIEVLKNIKYQIADKDIEVYKIVSDAMELEESNFSSAFCTTDLIYITKAYHSYTKIRFTLKKPCSTYSKHGYKGIIAGNLLMPIRIDNPYYVATFVIPKGSQYAINWKGEIVSNQIMYTGRYLKL